MDFGTFIKRATREDIDIAAGAAGGGLLGTLGAKRLHDELIRSRMQKQFPEAWKLLKERQVSNDMITNLRKSKGQLKLRGSLGIGGALTGATLGALIGSKLGPPKVNPYEFMQRDQKMAAREIDDKKVREYMRRMEEAGQRTNPSHAPVARLVTGATGAGVGTALGGMLGGLGGSALDKSISAVTKRKPGFTNWGAVLGLPLGAILGWRGGTAAADDLVPKKDNTYVTKRAKKEDNSPNILKAMLPSVGSGLLVGMGKGYAEKGLERTIAKALQKSKRLSSMRSMRNVPWGLSRGVTSALAGIPYTISAVLAAKELSKGNKKK